MQSPDRQDNRQNNDPHTVSPLASPRSPPIFIDLTLDDDSDNEYWNPNVPYEDWLRGQHIHYDEQVLQEDADIARQSEEVIDLTQVEESEDEDQHEDEQEDEHDTVQVCFTLALIWSPA